ncbi:flagellar protein FliT [Azohydromonas australica]|uniref:flagellar protein FliT n=1 Tax=Azohydromonas australica TaxID=364039 RepID=UPI00041DAA54|nr:flagellar protein FliT [Azohydromonas australica]
MTTSLLSYYEAIEKTSADMLSAARRGDWDAVIQLESACGVLISDIKQAKVALAPEQAKLKMRILQRILFNDAQIRRLAEPWLDELDGLLAARLRTVH